MLTIRTILRWLAASPESGQDMIEYALLVALLALVCIGGISAVGGQIGGVLGLWSFISNTLINAIGGTP